MRSVVLRAFGARVGRGCRFASSVDIAIPWNLRIGDGVRVGPRVLLYSLGTIDLGDGVTLDRRAHLCAGSHDFTDPSFPLLRPPITLGPGVFVGLDAFIGPDVTLGEGCVVHPRASVYGSHKPRVELRGNPAKPVDLDARAAAPGVDQI
jgi:putative colanic acid biosynthesis acetyltransferase WcaF